MFQFTTKVILSLELFSQAARLCCFIDRKVQARKEGNVSVWISLKNILHCLYLKEYVCFKSVAAIRSISWMNRILSKSNGILIVENTCTVREVYNPQIKFLVFNDRKLTRWTYFDVFRPLNHHWRVWISFFFLNRHIFDRLHQPNRWKIGLLWLNGEVKNWNNWI